MLATKPSSIFGYEAKNLPWSNKVFSAHLQISFVTRQHMESYLVAAASARSVNPCQLTEIARLSPALKHQMYIVYFAHSRAGASSFQKKYQTSFSM